MNNISIYGPNLVCCCVDDNKYGTLQGRLYCSGKKHAILFPDVYRILFAMEEYFDEIRFPMASTVSRDFLESKPTKIRKGGKPMHDRCITDHKGKKSTFLVQVQYRQNATWQGKIIWTEKNKTEYFRSALEMLKLIDSALGREAEAFVQQSAEAVHQ